MLSCEGFLWYEVGSTAWMLSVREVAQVPFRHLAPTAQMKYEKCWHKSQLLVLLTQCVYTYDTHLQIIREVIFDLLCFNTLLKTVTHSYVCWGPLCWSSERRALWLPPTEIHAEAESDDRAQNIGHVFVRRPQEPIPNSWHITAQSYCKGGSADSGCAKWPVLLWFVCSQFYAIYLIPRAVLELYILEFHHCTVYDCETGWNIESGRDMKYLLWSNFAWTLWLCAESANHTLDVWY